MEVEVGASRGMEGRRGLRRLRRPAQEGTAVGVEVEEVVVVVVMEGVERLLALSGRVRVNRSLYHDRGPVKMVGMRRRWWWWRRRPAECSCCCASECRDGHARGEAVPGGGGCRVCM